MAKDLIKYVGRNSPRGFTPRPYYGAEEDALTFYFRDDESYAERVNELLTVFLSLETDELVGCQVKGVRRHLKRLGNFGISIQHKKGKLGIIFHLLAYLTTEPGPRERYLELGQMARDVDLDIGELIRS